MSIYLHDIPLQEAMDILRKSLLEAGMWQILGRENIPVDEKAVGRVLSQPVWALISSPFYHSSAMDGYAVIADSTHGATVTMPIELKLGDEAVYVDTGDPLPEWADAVIPIEQVEPLDESGKIARDVRRPTRIRIRSAVVPWQHVRPMGEDIVATQLVLPGGHRIRAVDLGAVAACGQTHIEVARQPRVAIIPTGDELVPIGTPLKRGDIIESNSLVLAGQVISYGAKATRFGIVPDEFDDIREAVIQASKEHDLILLNAGSSAGSEDYSAKVIDSLGKVMVHGVAVRPGHPVIIGMVEREEVRDGRKMVPIIGVPGYPVSAALTNEIFVKPVIERWLGMPAGAPARLRATITKKLTSPAGDDDYVRVVVGKVGDRICAAPLSRGAGVITSLTQADGLVVIPRGIQGLEAGEQVDVQLFDATTDLERTILAIGSHDISLDLLAQYVAMKGSRLVSANVGSLGGLIALRRGESHIAGSHLLHPETGEYNIPFIKQYLPDMEVLLVGFAYRVQGLIVAPGNPYGIHSLEDLIRPEVSFINRQSGAGTRVLLDYHLKKKGIDPQKIKGYQRQEFTHLAIAAAVASGRATCGLGIAAAASALGLDFVPLFDEEYDLVIPKIYYESEKLQPLLDVISESGFREEVAKMSGYNPEPMGKIKAVIGRKR